jgi:hypothetical protein
MRKFLVFTTSILLFSCKQQQVVLNYFYETPRESIISGVFKYDANSFKSANYEINQARIANDSLIVDIAYSGGCKSHDFKLYQENKKYYIEHISYNDACRELIEEKLMFYIGSSKVKCFQLDKWNKEICK